MTLTSDMSVIAHPRSVLGPPGLSFWGPLLLSLCATACDAQLSGSDLVEDGAVDPDTPVDGAKPAEFSMELHRLNRLEYDRSLSDLLGAKVSYAADFPPDAAVSGFDNVASGLRMSPSLFDLYFQQARAVVEDTMVMRPRFELTLEPSQGRSSGFPVGIDAMALHGSNFEVSFELETPTLLHIAVPISGIQTGSAPVPSFQLLLDEIVVAEGDVQGTPTDPHIHEIHEELAAGEHQVRVVPTNFTNNGLTNTNNEVLVHQISLQSEERLPRVAGDNVFFCDLSKEDCGSQIVLRLAERAYRRPLAQAESDKLLSLYEELSESEGAESALLLTARTILSSSKFLYRSVRESDVDAEGRLSNFVLASRISYFLWSSIPDEELFRAARDGELMDDVGLTRQVVRMLEDPRTSALSDGFAEQWLAVRLLRNATPSKEAFPEFSEEVRAAMELEAKSLFAEFLREPLPLKLLPNPQFGFRNDALSAFHGEPLPGSETMKRVELSGSDRRGILELGSWLTSQSEPEHTSPIRRGRWVLDAVTCTPVPPPPAEVVPELPDIEGLTTRERLALHRTEPSCAACHTLLDPAGLGFETFDAIGRRRESDHGLPIDSSGAISDEITFSNPREFAERLSESETFTRCITRKLSIYALGRELTKADEPYLEEIHQGAGSAGTLQDLVAALILSPLFRTLRFTPSLL